VSDVLVSPLSLLIRGILAALRQIFPLSGCPDFASHLYRTWHRAARRRTQDNADDRPIKSFNDVRHRVAKARGMGEL
jgi:hypothetical protein